MSLQQIFLNVFDKPIKALRTISVDEFAPISTQDALAVGATSVALTVPDTADRAEIYVRDKSVVFSRNGNDPTATRGMQANVGDIIVIDSHLQLVMLRFIRQGASNGALDVEYYKRA